MTLEVFYGVLRLHDLWVAVGLREKLKNRSDNSNGVLRRMVLVARAGRLREWSNGEL